MTAVDVTGPAGGARAVSLPASSLSAGTRYLFRLVATNAASYLRPAGLAYLSLTGLLIFATWLLVFGH